MEKLDIYISRLGDIAESVILNLPHVGKTAIRTGFLGIELPKEEIYEIFIFLGNKGIDSAQIVPTKYKYLHLEQSVASNKALTYFKEVYPHLSINENNVHFLRENMLSYTYILFTSDLEPVYYVSIDKCDGHVHSKYEQYTAYQEEYYLNISTDLSLLEMHNLLLKYSPKAHILLSNEGVLDVFCFETLYINPHNCKRTFVLENSVNFVSHMRLTFYIPKYKKGYTQGRMELIGIVNFLSPYINEGILFSSFEDYFVLNLKNKIITINHEWKHFDSNA